MRTRDHSRMVVVLAVVVGSAIGTPAVAQYVEDPAQGTGLEQAVRDYALEVGFDLPSLEPSSEQIEAPSINTASPTLLDRALFTRLLAASLGQRLGPADGAEAVTVSLNLFAAAVARNPEALTDPELYRKNSPLRRVLGAVTLGGPIPGDSSGTIQRKITDHVEGNVKLRLIGSRDRRDHWADKYQGLQIGDVNVFQGRLLKTPEFDAATKTSAKEPAKYQGYLAALRAHPDIARDLLSAISGVITRLQAINDEVDQSMVVTLDVTADLFADHFGTNRYGATLIAEMGWPFNFTTNLGYRSTEEIRGDRVEELKLGTGANWRWFRNSMVMGPVDGSLTGSGLFRDGGRVNIWSLNTKLDFPLQGGLKLTTSMTWANHAEDVNESVVRGNFGLSYNLAPTP